MNLALHKQGDSVTFASQTQTGAVTTASVLAEVQFGGGSDGYIIGNADDFDLKIVGDKVQFVCFSGSETRTLTTPNTYSDSQRHLFVGVRDGLNVYLYVDGVQVASGAFTSNPTRSYKIQGIGQRGNNTNYGKFIAYRLGLLSKALSAGEVTALWNSGNPATLSAQANLMAGYNCNEGSGTTITDVSGNNKTGTIQNPNGVYTNWIDGTRTTPTTFFASPTGSIGNNGSANNAAWTTTYALSHPPGVIPGDTLKFKDGSSFSNSAHTSCYLTGNSSNSIIVRAESTYGHFPKQVKFDGAGIGSSGSIFDIYGKYVDFYDWEIYNSNPSRVTNQIGSAPTDIIRNMGVQVWGAGIRFFYPYIHDCNSNGIAVFDPAGDVTVHRALLINCGWRSTVVGERDHGHGLYTHNNIQSANIKWVDCVSINNYYYQAQQYTSQYAIDSYNQEWDGFHCSGTYGVGIVGASPKHNFKFKNGNVNAPVEFGYGGEDNYDLDADNLIVQSPSQPITARSWRNLNIKNSTLISTQTNLNAGLGTISKTVGNILGTLDFAGNAYYAKTGINVNQAFVVYNQDGSNPAYKTFAQWQSVPLDATSTATYSAGGKPTSNVVKYRPDSVVTGSGLFIVWNWQLLSTVSINLSNFGLVNGQNYDIFDCHNLGAGAIVSNVYNNSSPNINLSTASNGVAPRINDAGTTPAALLPEFGIFMVVPGAVAAGAPNAPSLPDSPNLPIQRINPTSITFKWKLNSINESNVLVRYRIVGNASWTQETLSNGITQLAKTTLTPGVTYEAEVSTINGSGQSAWLQLGETTTTVVHYFGSTEPSLI